MASNNLFKQLYSRDGSYQPSGYTCTSAVDESQTSFDISGDSGTITDSNGNTLASIDLSQIHVDDISQYNVETRILQPYSCYVLQGQEYGLARTTYYFELPDVLLQLENFGNYINVSFDVIYNQHCHQHLHIELPADGELDFTEAINQYFEEHGINVNCSIQKLNCHCDPSVTKDYFVIEAQTEGYFYYIKNFRLEPVIQSSEYPESPFYNGLEDIKLTVYNLIFKYKPLLDYQTEDDLVNYEVPCQLYEWILEKHLQAIDKLRSFTLALQKFDDFDAWYTENAEDYTEEAIHELYMKTVEASNELIADTVYNTSVLEHYDVANLKKIKDIIKELISEIEKASKRYAEHYWLEEIPEWRVPMMKYPNGAFKGIVIIPDYPNDDQYEYSTLYINHIQTLVNLYVPVHTHDCNDNKLYAKETFGVMSNAMFEQERQVCSANAHNGRLSFSGNTQLKTDIISGWDEADEEIDEDFGNPDCWQQHHHKHHECGCHDDHCDNPEHADEFDYELGHHRHDDIVYLGESCYSKKTKILGIFRYMDYVSDNHLWMKIGQGYMALGRDDNPQSPICNLLNSVMIYNPNDIPVRIKYLIFS